MPTEYIYLGLSGYAWLRFLFIAAIAIFSWRMWTLYRVLRLGREENRLNDIPLRIKTAFKEVMGQTRLFQEPVIGWAHPIIFWGFCLFCIASLLMLVGGMFPSVHISQVEEIPILGSIVDLFALLVIVGLVAAGIRRYVFTPQGLERTWDASVILVLIGGLMITYLLTEAGTPPDEGAYRPIGNAVGSVLNSLGAQETTIEGITLWSWWIHVFILLGFLVYLPFSKHMHLLWAPFAVFLAELPQKGTLTPPNDEESEGEKATPLSKYSWRMLLSAFSCAECGRCERVCPAATSGSNLSPKSLIHDFKTYVMDKGLGHLKGQKTNGNGFLGQTITPDMAWGCSTCQACMERCPVRNEHVPLIVEMRRQFVEEGSMDAGLQDALMSLQRYGNSLGKSPRKRAEWTKGLSFKIKDARKEEVDILWFVGDYASYHPSALKATQQIAELFHQAGLDFGILYEAEKSTGNDVRRTGEEGLYEMLAEQNMKALGKAKFKRIVTTDPHTYHALTHDYGSFGLEAPVIHYTQLFEELLKGGVILPQNDIAGRAVFHDPCYLGRINGIYDAPRNVMHCIGLDSAELPRNRDNSFCCGAGGGKMWMEDEKGVTERPASNRIKEALNMPDVSLFVVACPKDLAMFEDAVKTTGGEDRLQVVDVGELVYQSVKLNKEEEVAA